CSVQSEADRREGSVEGRSGRHGERSDENVDPRRATAAGYQALSYGPDTGDLKEDGEDAEVGAEQQIRGRPVQKVEILLGQQVGRIRSVLKEEVGPGRQRGGGGAHQARGTHEAPVLIHPDLR